MNRLGGASFIEDDGPNQATIHPAIAHSLVFMTRNYCCPIQVTDLAVASGMSRRGFFKAFKKCLGEPPAAVLRQLRIEFAKRLMEAADLPLKRIAVPAGFSSVNTFCIAFKRATGMSPKQYQRKFWFEALRSRPRHPQVQVLPTTKHRVIPKPRLKLVPASQAQEI